VHCKSLPAQELRAILTARKQVQSKHHDLEMSLRGILRGFGLKVGRTTPRDFEVRVRELIDGHATLHVVADAMLRARAVLAEQLGKLQKCLASLARKDMRARLLMSTPGVGVIVALTYVAAIDDPERFRSSKSVGAHFGLTPKRYQSGETDVTGRISRIGDASVRTALYEAANVILTRPVRGSLLKSWAMRVAKRAGMRKAKVALRAAVAGALALELPLCLIALAGAFEGSNLGLGQDPAVLRTSFSRFFMVSRSWRCHTQRTPAGEMARLRRRSSLATRTWP
jgi:transposase